MRTTKVKADELGLFVYTNGTKFRPGGIPGYDHAYEMDDAGLKAGDQVQARHVPQTEMASIKLMDGRTRRWATDYCHERHRPGYKGPPIRTTTLPCGCRVRRGRLVYYPDAKHADVCGRNQSGEPAGLCHNPPGDYAPCPLSQAIEGDDAPCKCCDTCREFCRQCI